MAKQVAKKKLFQARMEDAVVDAIRVQAAQDGTSPGAVVSTLVRKELPVVYRSMVRRLKEGA